MWWLLKENQLNTKTHEKVSFCFEEVSFCVGRWFISQNKTTNSSVKSFFLSISSWQIHAIKNLSMVVLQKNASSYQDFQQNNRKSSKTNGSNRDRSPEADKLAHSKRGEQQTWANLLLIKNVFPQSILSYHGDGSQAQTNRLSWNTRITPEGNKFERFGIHF